MLIVLFIIFLIMIIIGIKLCYVSEKNWSKDWSSMIWVVGTFGTTILCICEFIIVICTIACAFGISQLKVADRKIQMYEEENNNIQNQVTDIIENYKNYEQNTYTESLKNIDINNTDVVVLSQLYPDIKSNEMVSKQIQIYQDNNNKIKEIKEEKLNNEICKWWLYFGNIEEVANEKD